MTTGFDALSAIRAFNRFELKYLIGRDQIEEVRRDLSDRLVVDPHSGNGSYGVWSLYYDTADLRFYWEKIDGIKFRRKLRIRHYGEPASLEDETMVFVEIKQRVNRVTQKRRIRVDYATARRLCDERQIPDLADRDDRVVAGEVAGLAGGHDLRPTAITGYQRLALLGNETDSGLRITFDTHLRGRTTDLQLHSTVATPAVLDPAMVIVEVKVNERVPYWLTEKIARHNMQLIRVSKYCTSVDGVAPPGLRLRTEVTP